MARTVAGTLALGIVLSVGTLVSGDTVFRSALHDYRVVTVVEALVQPWSIAFLPNGDTLITERPDYES
jgi:aldose sugar dehydrogenase